MNFFAVCSPGTSPDREAVEPARRHVDTRLPPQRLGEAQGRSGGGIALGGVVYLDEVDIELITEQPGRVGDQMPGARRRRAPC